jgi:hypothetical protein
MAHDHIISAQVFGYRVVKGHRGCFFTSFSDGSLIDERMAGSLAETGNLTPVISVEGFDESTDGRRARGPRSGGVSTNRRVLAREALPMNRETQTPARSAGEKSGSLENPAHLLLN